MGRENKGPAAGRDGGEEVLAKLGVQRDGRYRL